MADTSRESHAEPLRRMHTLCINWFWLQLMVMPTWPQLIWGFRNYINSADIVSTRVLPGLMNASTYFQSAILLVFDDIKHIFKAWIIDYTIQSMSERVLLDNFESSSWFSINTIFSYQQRTPCSVQSKQSGVSGLLIRRETDLIQETWKQYKTWRIPSTPANYVNLFTVADGWATRFPTSTDTFKPWMTSSKQHTR